MNIGKIVPYLSHGTNKYGTNMSAKYKVSFKLRPSGEKNIVYLIQLHVSYWGDRTKISTGCQINTADAWDNALEEVRSGYEGPNGETTASINKTIHTYKESIKWAFNFFEVNDVVPTMSQVVDKFKERLLGDAVHQPKREKKEPKKPKAPSLFDVFDMFTAEGGEKNAWTVATKEKMAALKEDLTTFNATLKFADLDDGGLTAFVRYLREDKVLKTPRKKKKDRSEDDTDATIGLKNSTIDKKLGYLRWFLKWATNKGYNQNLAYKTFRPTLKATQKKVIYLTAEEQDRLWSLELTGNNANLEPVRDVFIFCCFTGLRHSDAYQLRRIDIKGDHIEVTTVKTADSLSIELNDIAKYILDKYKAIEFPDGKALPVLENQSMNRDLKDLCKLAGINEEIRITTYKGNERQDTIKQKWELIGTHTARRTFIVTALSKGIPPNVVMKWTGHSDYKSMKPYIDIVDSAKAKAMVKFNDILTIPAN